VPPWVADDAAPVFEAAIDVPAPERKREANPTVAAVLVVFGARNVRRRGRALVAPCRSRGFRAWFAAFAGVFGFLFLAAAWRER